MPLKIRELEQRLRGAGFVCTAGKGSHRKWRHPGGAVLILSGKAGQDAKPYQEKIVVEKIEQALRRDG